MAETLQPDLILLDLSLPKMDGFEVAEQIPRLAPHARVLFMSQESSPDIVRKALDLGARGYIQKISAATDLLPGIDAVLAGQRFVSRSLAFTTLPMLPCRAVTRFCSVRTTRRLSMALLASLLPPCTPPMQRSPWSRSLTEHFSWKSCARRVWTLTAPSSAAPACHLTLTPHLTPSDFSRRSTLCVRPPPKPGKPFAASLFAGNVPDACGPLAERRRRFSSKNSVANWRTTSTFCARIRCRMRPTIRGSRASARSTPPSRPASRWNVRCV